MATASPASAFSKLMSTNAEDEAWASAAAAEQAARGRPAFERTCPFYKILPGFAICVDAFRYGGVAGCAAYFLSHFHSDHYVGLTSTWAHGPIYCSRVTANLVRQQLRVDPKLVVPLGFEKKTAVPGTPGVQVTMIPANHCPGSALFLFERAYGGSGGPGQSGRMQRVLHCGDFRACPAHVRHPLLRPDIMDASGTRNIGQQKIDVCYLDTTYLNPRYAFPNQDSVITACADICVSLSKECPDYDNVWEGSTGRRRATGGSGMPALADAAVALGARKSRVAADAVDATETHDDGVVGAPKADAADAREKSSNSGSGGTGRSRGRLLVVVGTYSIGKERICLGIARALGSKIYAPAAKRRICACLDDAELSALLTPDPHAAQVHMTPLFEIRADTLQAYLDAHKPRFARVVGFRPSGWNYRPPRGRAVDAPAVQAVLQSPGWRSAYSAADLVPQRGSTREARCFGVPYSEHSSFRELTMFCCALRIDKIIPTVNVGSAKSRERMKAWFEKWEAEKKKHGLFRVADDQQEW
jgi:DNA cross-link repair 1A protein